MQVFSDLTMNGVKLLCIKLSNYAQKLPVGLNGISPITVGILYEDSVFALHRWSEGLKARKDALF